MAKIEGQKLKLLYLLDILRENTDENHYISTQDIIAKLSEYGINAERKSIYSDIDRLREFGIDIEKIGSRLGGGYFLASREFELAELKLLVDAVSASKFITAKKSRELIKKLEKLCSKYDALRLSRQVFVAGRIKTENESIYYSVDAIHNAIQDNKQISFKYYDWNLNKELCERDDRVRRVSPWALIWKDENYYLAAFDHDSQIMKHFRVDKMGKVNICLESREGTSEYEKLDLAAYSNKNIGMFSGKEEIVVLELPNRLSGVVIDKFGTQIDLRPVSEDYFRARIKVSISGQLFGWMCGIGKDVKIISPKNVKDEYNLWLENIIKANKI